MDRIEPTMPRAKYIKGSTEGLLDGSAMLIQRHVIATT